MIRNKALYQRASQPVEIVWMWISAGFSTIHKVNVEFGLLKMDHKRGKECEEGHKNSAS